jgi:hypothetical protein
MPELNLSLVTPIHSPILNKQEIKRLNITLNHNSEFDHFFAVPESMSLVEIKRLFPNSKYKRFEDNNFSSLRSYNQLLMTNHFYSQFLGYDYILITQLDSFLLRNLNPLLDFNFTYLGAAWNPSFFITEFKNTIFINRNLGGLGVKTEIQSGNGGLSLRKPSIIYETIEHFQHSALYENLVFGRRKFNEDVLNVYFLTKYGVEPIARQTANQFFIESTSQTNYDIDRVFGFHALHKFDSDLEIMLLGDELY